MNMDGEPITIAQYIAEHVIEMAACPDGGDPWFIACQLLPADATAFEKNAMRSAVER